MGVGDPNSTVSCELNDSQQVHADVTSLEFKSRLAV